MAAVCPIGFDVEGLKGEVRRTYAAVATDPRGEFHFHRGPEYATRQLGYDSDELARLPRFATEPFAGVGNPFKMGRLPAGATVIDIGSGAGMDCLLAGLDIGPAGRVVGIDMTDEMLERARRGAAHMGLTHVRFEKADMEQLPFDDESVDVVISNGVINLATDKPAVFAELLRVLRPGGRLQFADIIIGTELSEDARNSIDLWAGWIAGALQSAELVRVLTEAGFRDVVLHDTFDSFRGTSKERTARKFGVMGVNISAYRWDSTCGARFEQCGGGVLPARLRSCCRCWRVTARASLSLHCQLSGITLAINEGAWSATFLTLGALAVIAVAAGTRKHGRMRRSSSRSPTAPPGYAHVVTFSFAKLSDPPC